MRLVSRMTQGGARPARLPQVERVQHGDRRGELDPQATACTAATSSASTGPREHALRVGEVRQRGHAARRASRAGDGPRRRLRGQPRGPAPLAPHLHHDGRRRTAAPSPAAQARSAGSAHAGAASSDTTARPNSTNVAAENSCSVIVIPRVVANGSAHAAPAQQNEQHVGVHERSDAHGHEGVGQQADAGGGEGVAQPGLRPAGAADELQREAPQRQGDEHEGERHGDPAPVGADDGRGRRAAARRGRAGARPAPPPRRTRDPPEASGGEETDRQERRASQRFEYARPPLSGTTVAATKRCGTDVAAPPARRPRLTLTGRPVRPAGAPAAPRRRARCPRPRRRCRPCPASGRCRPRSATGPRRPRRPGRRSGELGVQASRDLGRRRLLDRELHGRGGLHRRERVRRARHLLVDLLTLHRALDPERVVAGSGGDEERPVLAGPLLEVGRESELHLLVAVEHGGSSGRRRGLRWGRRRPCA